MLQRDITQAKERAGQYRRRITRRCMAASDVRSITRARCFCISLAAGTAARRSIMDMFGAYSIHSLVVQYGTVQRTQHLCDARASGLLHDKFTCFRYVCACVLYMYGWYGLAWLQSKASPQLPHRRGDMGRRRCLRRRPHSKVPQCTLPARVTRGWRLRCRRIPWWSKP
jgi:hypothetical protein